MHIVDMMKNDEIALVVNTVQEKCCDPRQRPDLCGRRVRPDPDVDDGGGRARRGAGRRGMRELVPDSIEAWHERLPDAGEQEFPCAESIEVP